MSNNDNEISSYSDRSKVEEFLLEEKNINLVKTIDYSHSSNKIDISQISYIITN